MTFVLEPGPLLNLVSGLVVLALGGALVGLDHRVRVNQAVGTFGVAWGVQIVAANLVSLTDHTPTALVASALSVELVLLLPLLYVLAVRAVHPDPLRPMPFATALVVGAAVVAAGLMLVRPELVLGELAVRTDKAHVIAWGAAVPWLASLPFTAAYAAALWSLHQARREAATPHARRWLSTTYAALLVYGAYRMPDSVLAFSVRMADGPITARGLGELAVGAFGTIVVIALVIALLRDHRATIDIAQRRELRLLLAAAIVPAVAAGLRFTPLLVGLPDVSTLGLFRLVAIALLVRAAAHVQLRGLDDRLRQWAPVFGASLTPFVVVPLVAPLSQAFAAPPTVAALLAALVAVPLALSARRLAGPPVATDHEAARRRVYLEARGAGLTGAALERVAARLGIDADDRARLDATADPTREALTAPQPGDLFLGTYRIDRTLGSGGQGTATLATDVLLERPVVIKSLGRLPDERDARERMLHEGRVAARLDHPHVVKVFTVERADDQLFLVTEFVANGDLAKRLAEQGVFELEAALPIVAQVLDALEAVHAQGVVHGDVTPGNVFLDDQGKAKLGDFGLAAHRDEGGGPAGTLVTAAPEQLTGAGRSEASDLFAVGALLYWMVTGRCHVPLEGRPFPQAVQLVCEQPSMLPLPGLPAHLNDVLARALAKKPEARFPSARAMRDAIGDVDLASPGTTITTRSG